LNLLFILGQFGSASKWQQDYRRNRGLPGLVFNNMRRCCITEKANPLLVFPAGKSRNFTAQAGFVVSNKRRLSILAPVAERKSLPSKRRQGL
jgi:hypothetical protein